MAARNEKEKQKANQEKYQAILTSLLRDEDNKYCVDCDSKGPRWASWNLGIFLCIRCAGIHRNLGVHITKVKSVNLDSWTPEQIAHMQAMGNSRARAVYEANMPDGYRRPQTDSALEAFIRTKYEQRKWIAKEWVPPKIETPVVRDAEEVKEKKRTVSGGGTPRQKQSESASTTSRPRPSMPKSGSPSPAAVTTAGESSRSRPAANPNPIDELISIDDPSSSNVAPQAVPTQYSAGSGASNPILELFDEPVPSQSQGHGHSIAGQPDRPYQQSQQSPPAQFQSQPQSGGPAAAAAASGSSSSNDLIGLMGLNDKMDKQSILALYKPTSQPQSAPIYGVPGGTYVTQGGGMSITPMMGMPTSMNPQGMAPVRQPMMASQHQAMMAAQHQQMMAQQHQPMMAPQHQQFPNQQQQQQAYNPNPMMQGFNPMNQLQFQMNQMSMGAPQPAWRGPSFPAARPSFGMNTVPQGNTLSSNLWQ